MHAQAKTHTHTQVHLLTVHSAHTTLCYLHSAHVVAVAVAASAAAFTVILVVFVLVQFPCYCTLAALQSLSYTNSKCDVNSAGALSSSLFFFAYNSLTHSPTHVSALKLTNVVFVHSLSERERVGERECRSSSALIVHPLPASTEVRHNRTRGTSNSN